MIDKSIFIYESDLKNLTSRIVNLFVEHVAFYTQITGDGDLSITLGNSPSPKILVQPFFSPYSDLVFSDGKIKFTEVGSESVKIALPDIKSVFDFHTASLEVPTRFDFRDNLKKGLFINTFPGVKANSEEQLKFNASFIRSIPMSVFANLKYNEQHKRQKNSGNALPYVMPVRINAVFHSPGASRRPDLVNESNDGDFFMSNEGKDLYKNEGGSIIKYNPKLKNVDNPVFNDSSGLRFLGIDNDPEKIIIKLPFIDKEYKVGTISVVYTDKSAAEASIVLTEHDYDFDLDSSQGMIYLDKSILPSASKYEDATIIIDFYSDKNEQSL